MTTQNSGQDIFFLSAVRTPFGTYGGSLRDVPVVENVGAVMPEIGAHPHPEVILDPGLVVALLNTFFSLLTDIAYRHGGTIFNMAGDCLMVGFGVPFQLESSSAHACRCAQDMLKEFEALANDWRGEHDVNVGLGIGIDEGEVIAGNVGSPTYMNFTIIGDVVNTAARLKDHAKAGTALLTGRVRDSLTLAGTGVVVMPLAPLHVKGKQGPLSVFQFSAT